MAKPTTEYQEGFYHGQDVVLHKMRHSLNELFQHYAFAGPLDKSPTKVIHECIEKLDTIEAEETKKRNM